MEAPIPFEIKVPDDVLEDLKARLRAARFPEQVGEDWVYGTPVGYLRSLCDYWANRYDWRTHEAALNGFDQFTTRIAGERLHFIHQRSPEPAAQPLLITHGWPGSISEFAKIIGPLTNPRAHGGDPADAFHVVAPSMPGYGFSEAPRQPGCGAKQVAQRFAELMAGLGYERYFAQGGDWGSAVSTWIAVEDAAHVAAIHLNLVFARQPKDGAGGATDAELARMKERAGHMREGVGYQAIQGTKPQTLGYALNDSPAGLAGWIGEKFHGWTHHDGDHEKAVSRDELLTNVTIYWVTQTATSAARLYYENGHVGDRYPERIETPTCVAMFPGELALPPRAWVEAQYNVVHWQEQARGGHFAALEAPELLVADIRNAFRRLR